MRWLAAMLAVVVLVGVWTARGLGGVDPEGLDEPDSVPDGSLRPGQFSQVLPREAIRPIYKPEFTTADRSALQDDELVLGVAIGGEARAYSVSVLNSRELVNDIVGGVPIIVTW